MQFFDSSQCNPIRAVCASSDNRMVVTADAGAESMGMRFAFSQTDLCGTTWQSSTLFLPFWRTQCCSSLAITFFCFTLPRFIICIFLTMFSVLCSLYLCISLLSICSLISALCSLLSSLCSLVSALCFLLSAVCSVPVVVWDSISGAPLATLVEPHPAGCVAVDITPDSAFILTLSNDYPQVLCAHAFTQTHRDWAETSEVQSQIQNQ